MLLNKAEAKGPVTEAEKDNLRSEAYTYIASLSVIGALSRADQLQISKVRDEVTKEVQKRLEMLESSGDWYDDPSYRQDEQKFLNDLRDKIFAQVLADRGYGTPEDFNRTYAYTTDALDTFIESIKSKSEKKPDGKGASTKTPSGEQQFKAGDSIVFNGVTYKILSGGRLEDSTGKIFKKQGSGLVEVN